MVRSEPFFSSPFFGLPTFPSTAPTVASGGAAKTFLDGAGELKKGSINLMLPSHLLDGAGELAIPFYSRFANAEGLGKSGG